MKQNYSIYLASKSPRRREILTLMEIDYQVAESDAEEDIDESEPSMLVEKLSYKKAVMCHTPVKECVVIGADTVVSYNGRILGKPKEPEDAVRMLTMLSGQVHSVYTGVTVLVKGKNSRAVTFHTETEVVFDTLTAEEIAAYVASSEPMDKAGAYGIQGTFGKHIKAIRGDYYNVMGLPMNDLYKKLKEENVIFI